MNTMTDYEKQQEMAEGVEEFLKVRKQSKKWQKAAKERVIEFEGEVKWMLNVSCKIDREYIVFLRDCYKDYSTIEMKIAVSKTPMFKHNLSAFIHYISGDIDKKCILDKNGLPIIQAVKDCYKKKLRWIDVMNENLSHDRNTEKFWRYCYYMDNEKATKYHNKMAEHESEFLMDCMERDADGEECKLETNSSLILNSKVKSIRGIELGETEKGTSLVENCGETIRLMGESMKETFQQRQFFIEEVCELNSNGCGKQLVK